MTRWIERLKERLRNPESRVTTIGWTSLALGLAILVLGYAEYGSGGLSGFFQETYSNTAFTCLGVASTVLLVDRLNATRASHAELQSLKRDLSSADPHHASRAARELRSRRDLESGALDDTDLRGAALSGVHLAGLVARRSSFVGARLDGTDLSGANLDGATLDRANLSRANVEGSTLVGASFVEADLTQADLAQAILRGADLSGASLRSADLRRADLRGAVLIGADMAGANTEGAIFD